MKVRGVQLGSTTAQLPLQQFRQYPANSGATSDTTNNKAVITNITILREYLMAIALLYFFPP
jgi:hypothetical protein